MLLWFLLLVTSGLLKDTKALSVGETHPSERRESDVSGAIWDYIVVSGFFQCYMSLYRAHSTKELGTGSGPCFTQKNSPSPGWNAAIQEAGTVPEACGAYVTVWLRQATSQRRLSECTATKPSASCTMHRSAFTSTHESSINVHTTRMVGSTEAATSLEPLNCPLLNFVLLLLCCFLHCFFLRFFPGNRILLWRTSRCL